jgi:hypothetical protein
MKDKYQQLKESTHTKVMAQIKYSKLEIFDFNRRLLNVYSKLPENYVSLTLEELPDKPTDLIEDVRYNKAVDFDILKAFEKIAEMDIKNFDEQLAQRKERE